MANRYPHQILSRLHSAEEKEAVEKLAKDNGVSISAIVRLLVLQAYRDGWSIGLLRKRRAA